MMLKRKISSKDLAQKIGITPANLSILKTGKAKGIRFETLEKICQVLDCQPGDLLRYKPDAEDLSSRKQVLIEILKEFIANSEEHDERAGNNFLIERLNSGLDEAENSDQDIKELAHEIYQNIATICLVNKLQLDEEEEKLWQRMNEIAQNNGI